MASIAGRIGLRPAARLIGHGWSLGDDGEEIYALMMERADFVMATAERAGQPITSVM